MNLHDFENVSTAVLEEAHELLPYNIVNVALGVVCSIINIPLILIFVTYKHFRAKYQVLLTLAIADLINCIGITAMGIHRILLYNSILDTSLVPIKTQWECAIEPWLGLRGAGDLWPPIIQLLMGIERFVAVFMPLFYKKTYQNKTVWTILFSLLFVVFSLLVGFAVSWTNRDVKQRYKCGRRAAFSVTYASFIYITNILGYFVGFLLNCTAYCRVALSSRLNENKNVLTRIRYYLIISLLSTLLVSLPNLISLNEVFFKKISDFISKPAVWATCVNSSINFFVYFAINREFRSRCLHLIGISRESVRTFTDTS